MPNMKDKLQKKLSKKQMQLLRKSFDIIGDIALVEIPQELTQKEKVIAKAVLEMHKNVKSVFKEASGRLGKHRLQKLKWLAGLKKTETICKENGILLKLDVAKVYFSPRLANERERIYKQVKKGEEVLVMFSGVAPYVIEIAKHTAASAVHGIELNKVAHMYALTNVKLNKVENIKLYAGDVRKVMPKLKKFSRIAMPLPKGAEPYLELALKHIKKNGVIHFYDFVYEKEIPSAAEKVRRYAKKLKKKVKIIRVVKCGQLSPRKYRICIDFKVL